VEQRPNRPTIRKVDELKSSPWGRCPLGGGCVVVPRPHSTCAEAQGTPAVYGYRVVNVYPHDAGAYTQGLIFRDGFLFESTGLNGRSTVRKVKLETGRSFSSIVSIRPILQRA
jgi:glutamine cyclotransferase